jgi:hypothetical protein
MLAFPGKAFFMLFGFEFAIGVMLAFVIVPLVIAFLVLAFKTAARLELGSTAKFVAKSVVVFMLVGTAIVWVVTH